MVIIIILLYLQLIYTIVEKTNQLIRLQPIHRNQLTIQAFD